MNTHPGLRVLGLFVVMKLSNFFFAILAVWISVVGSLANAESMTEVQYRLSVREPNDTPPGHNEVLPKDREEVKKLMNDNLVTSEM